MVSFSARVVPFELVAGRTRYFYSLFFYMKFQSNFLNLASRLQQGLKHRQRCKFQCATSRPIPFRGYSRIVICKPKQARRILEGGTGRHIINGYAIVGFLIIPNRVTIRNNEHGWTFDSNTSAVKIGRNSNAPFICKIECQRDSGRVQELLLKFFRKRLSSFLCR